MPRMKRVIFYLSPDQYARLSELALEQSRAGDRVSVAHLLREAVRERQSDEKNESKDCFSSKEVSHV